jgi:predicted TIM-barrel fold metal-dependent hydrolase
MPETSKPPTGLQKAGERLWTTILNDVGPGWRLDARELRVLERACRVENKLRQLEAVVDHDGMMSTGSTGQAVVHPALAEARQLRLVQARLLGQIELCSPEAGTRTASTYASRASRARWAS